MRTFQGSLLVLLMAALSAGGLSAQAVAPKSAHVVTESEYERWKKELSNHNLKNGIFTRGILIDIPRLKGVPYLEPGTPIYVEDLEAWEKKAGIKVSAGDALFVRTGVWARRKAVGPWLRGRAEGGRSAGLDPGQRPSTVRIAVESPRSCSRLRITVLGRAPVR